MPRYVYRCKTCEEEFLVFHSMSETLVERDGCENSCCLERIPQMTINVKQSKHQKQKVGAVVENFIAETKEELKQEKEELVNKREFGS